MSFRWCNSIKGFSPKRQEGEHMIFLVTDNLLSQVIAQFNTRKEAHDYRKELRQLYESENRFSCYDYPLNNDITFESIYEHYRVQYKDSNTNKEELYSIEALGFFKGIAFALSRTHQRT